MPRRDPPPTTFLRNSIFRGRRPGFLRSASVRDPIIEEEGESSVNELLDSNKSSDMDSSSLKSDGSSDFDQVDFESEWSEADAYLNDSGDEDCGMM